MRIELDEVLMGYKAIAERMECSVDTLQQMIRDEGFPVFRSEPKVPRRGRGGSRPRVRTSGAAVHCWAFFRATGMTGQGWQTVMRTLIESWAKIGGARGKTR